MTRRFQNLTSCSATEHPAVPGPALSRDRLGARLRRHREDQGLRLEDVAASMGIAPSTLSRIETGKAPARAAYVGILISLYGIDNPEEQQHLTDLARHGRGSEWHSAYRDLLPAGAGHCLTLEAEAAALRILANQAIPLLLATPAYAAAECQAARPDLTPRQTRLMGALVTRRQEIADRTAVRLHVILDEAALHRPVGSPDIHAGQLARLTERAAGAQTTVQVLPLDTSWPVLTTPFSLLTFNDSVPPAGCTITATGQHIITRRDTDTRRLDNAFSSLSRAALSPGESARLIGDLAAQAAG